MICGIRAIMRAKPEKYKNVSINCGCENGHFIVSLTVQPAISIINRALLFMIKALNPTKYQSNYNELIAKNTGITVKMIKEEFHKACANVIKAIKSAKIAVLAGDEKFKGKIKEPVWPEYQTIEYDKKQIPTREKFTAERKVFDTLEHKTVLEAMKTYMTCSQNGMSATVKNGKTVQVLSNKKISDTMRERIAKTANLNKILCYVAAVNCFVDVKGLTKEF